MDAAETFTRFVHGLSYDDLSPGAIEVTRVDVLDTISTILGGSGQPGCGDVVGLVQDWGGKPESTVLVYGNRVPAPMAAWANGTMGHALDYDDTYDLAAPLHAGVSIVPAALAAAEHSGGVSGKALMTAVAGGVEFMCRMSKATIGGLNGWHLTAVYGTLASAMAAAKVMGLDERGISNAVGIAYASASGNLQCVDDAALTKRLQAGLAAQGGVQSALLAERGFTGSFNTLEGENGLFNVYHGGNYDPAPLTNGLGEIWEMERLSFKPWPSCRYTHTYVTATLDLVESNDLQAAAVEEVIVAPPVLCDPLEVKQSPRTIVDAQFSVPYTVARAVIGRKVGIGDFTDAAIADPELLEMTHRVHPRAEDEIMAGYWKQVTEAIVEIRMTDGRSFKKRVDFPFGHPDNPMPFEAFVEKFRDCASWAARTIDDEAQTRLLTEIRQLETLSDVTGLVDLAVGAKAPAAS